MEMGFDGVVISDALNMHAVSKNYPKKGELEWLAFDAGNDVLCFAEHVADGIEVILKNASEVQIEQRFHRVWKLKEKALQAQVPVSILPAGEAGSNAALEIDTALNRKLAENSLTLLKGSPTAISEFFRTDFIGTENSHIVENQFFKLIYRNKKFTSKLFMIDAVETEENILLALFPPQVKPAHCFGLHTEEIDLINELLETKKVVLYLFGNPYLLRHLHIEHAIAVVVAYQNFTEFQDVAAAHFTGNLIAKGKLPVRL